MRPSRPVGPPRRERLRAWDARYGLLAPDRSDGGFRLYSDRDVARVQAMLEYLGGVSAAEAEWDRKLNQRIAAGQRTGKTMLSPERRILLFDQLVDEVLGGQQPARQRGPTQP